MPLSAFQVAFLRVRDMVSSKEVEETEGLDENVDRRQELSHRSNLADALINIPSRF